MDANNQIVTRAHGGYRQGAGRKIGSRDRGLRLTGKELGLRLERLQRSGAIALTSNKVMTAIGDAEYWLHLIAELERAQEWGMLVDVLKFHQQMRDGRPSQQINVTSAHITISAEAIARARAVVRELAPRPVTTTVIVGELVTDSAPPSTADDSGINSNDHEDKAKSNRVVTGEAKAKHNVFEGQGAK